MNPPIGISYILNTAAAAVGKNLLDRIADVSTPPERPSDAANRAATAFPAVLSAAQAAQDDLVAYIATVDMVTDDYEKMSDAAQAQEKVLDSTFAAMGTSLSALVKLGADGSRELWGRLFPGGTTVVTQLSGRSQVGEYLSWYAIASDPTTAASPAYGAISGLLPTFKAHLDAFAAALAERDSLALKLNAARENRDAAQELWTDTFRELIAAAARLHGEDSVAFRGWIKPILEWKAAQEAARTRKASAADAPADPPAPADVVVDTEDGD